MQKQNTLIKKVLQPTKSEPKMQSLGYKKKVSAKNLFQPVEKSDYSKKYSKKYDEEYSSYGMDCKDVDVEDFIEYVTNH
jgi:hypothetical protein